MTEANDDKTDGRLPPELEPVFDRLVKRLDDIGMHILGMKESVSLRMRRMAMRHALDDAWHAGRRAMVAEAAELFGRVFGGEAGAPDAGADPLRDYGSV